MKDFNQLSGPWIGLSTQDGIRIQEAIRLFISDGRIEGTGTDKDGDFELVGSYHARDEQVRITRRYTRVTNPWQEGIGYPYDYEGIWDGAMVHGRWHARGNARTNGPFEMWPSREEDQQELRIELEIAEAIGTARARSRF